MSKNTVVLADSSYTIRRIVELSFQEEDIELISFENGLNLKEKLVEIKPAVLLVDIKLPDLNGYEVTKFISETESLKDTKVFLMKGGFEPVDENLIKDLQYVDIITKPFDSNALVSAIKKILETSPEEVQPSAPVEAPSSLPEDLPEIDSISEPGEGISFSDIKEEIDADDEMKEEVQPSEEITQGAQQEKEDALSPDEPDDLENPFQDEEPAVSEDQETLSEEEQKIKENIKMQEDELDIGSLTMEEIKIKEQLKKQQEAEEEKPAETGEEAEGKQDETAETLEESKLDEVEEETVDEDSVMSDIIPEPETKEVEAPVAEPEIEAETPEKIEEIPKMDVEVPGDEEKEEATGFLEESESDTLSDIDDQKPAEEPEIETQPEFEEPKPAEEPEIEAKPEITEPSPKKEEEAPEEKAIEFEKEIEDEKFFEEEKEPEAQPDVSPVQKEEILHKVEDKLTVSIKEVLWEIIPPLAEKIIKEEIDKIKTDIDKDTSK